MGELVMRALVIVTLFACGEPQRSDTAESTLGGDALIARVVEVKEAAEAIGISNPVLVAGIGYHESGLQQCWSEATWSCPGPYSDDCGGPVLTGAYDGPCWWEQGGIGMFQLDSGTYADTPAEHGDSVLEVAGNAQAGAGFIAYKVRICPNTPVFDGDQEVIDWINSALPGTDRFEEFLTAMAWCYNGCAPSFTGCSHTGMRENYRNGVQEMIDLMGWDFWASPTPDEPDEPDAPGELDPIRPAAAQHEDGRIALFARAIDGSVRSLSQVDPDSGWAAWIDLGGSIASQPEAVLAGNGRIYVFARGEDGLLRSQSQQQVNGEWTYEWEALGIAIDGAPSASVGEDGRVRIVARSGGEVWTIEQESRSGGWIAPRRLGFRTSIDPVIAGERVFAAGEDGALWQLEQSWSSLGGTVDSPPIAIADANGLLEVFATDGGAVRHIEQTSASSWSAWTAIEGAASDLTAARSWDGTIALFARSGSEVVASSQDEIDGRFSAFASLGGDAAGPPRAESHRDGTIEVFAPDANGRIAHRSWPDGEWLSD